MRFKGLNILIFVMAGIKEEKRLCPRVKTSLSVGISKDICAESIDLSESGLSLSSAETISSPPVSLQIQFPDTHFTLKTGVKLVWKRDLESGGSLYGLEFVDLDESQKSELRRELIKTQISGLLRSIKIPEVKKLVSDFFLKDIFDYISKMIKLCSHLNQEKRYSDELEKELEQLNIQILLKGYCLEELLSDKLIAQKIKDNFRQLVGVWSYKSIILKLTYENPSGYPEDYRLLEIIYDNKPISRNNFGVYFDNFFLKSPYAVAVRMRKERFRELLQYYINKTALTKINILNIACGSSREVRELVPDLKTKSSIVLSCLDWDRQALKFSQDALLQIAPKNMQLKFIKEDILNIFKNESVAQSLGRQDIIYSVGLFDYLPNRVFKKLLYALYPLLQKEGRLILTHKNREKTFPIIPPDWFCGWRFIPRNREEVTKLLYDSGISGFSLSTESDDFGYIYYFTLTKKP